MRQRPDGAAPRRRPQAESTAAKPAVRKRPRTEETRPSGRSRPTSSNNAAPPGLSSTARRAPTDAAPADTLREGLRKLLGTAKEAAKTRMHQFADEQADGGLVDKIRERLAAFVGEVEPGSPGTSAGLAGVQAVLKGKNPAVAAIKGFVSGLSVGAKIGIVLALILALLLGPVALVLLLLVLLVAVVVAAVKGEGE